MDGGEEIKTSMLKMVLCFIFNSDTINSSYRILYISFILFYLET